MANMFKSKQIFMINGNWGSERRGSRFPAARVNAMLLACALAVTLPATAATTSRGEKVAHGSNCFSCHAVDHKVVGPAFASVAKRFAGKPNAKATLMHAVKYGHVGTWGKIPMPPHPKLSKTQLEEVIGWVLSIKPSSVKTAAAPHKTYTYTYHGKKITLGFAVYKPGTKKVTKMVFRGYELYNSYCFRCHGEDANGSEYAPNLRHAISRDGLTREQLIRIAMEGRKAKGMPAWAGFFSPHEMEAIYEYVAGRAYNLVGQGIPPH